MNIVRTTDISSSAGNSVDSLCHQIAWKPDLKLLSDVEITQLCETESATDSEGKEFCMDLDFSS